MSNDLVPSGGEDGSIVVSVDSRQAMAGLNTLETRLYGFVYNTQNMFNRWGNTFGSMFNAAFGKLHGALGGLTAGFGSLLAQIGKFVALREVFNLFEGFVSRVIEVNRTVTGFIASMSVIKGSVAAATQEYKFLLDVSKKLGVDLEASITQYHRLAAALKNVDTTGELARNLFVGVSEAALVLHSRGRDVTLIFEAIQQMASKGKLSLEELQRQLGNTLPGAVSLAARAMMNTKSFLDAGVKSASEAEQLLRKKIKDGTINVYEFLLNLSNQLKKEYGAGAAYAAQQFTAAFNSMKATIFNFFKEVGDGGMADGLTKIIRSITDLFDKGGAIGGSNIGKTFGDMFGQIANWISKLSASDVEQFFEAVRTAISSTFTIVEEFLGVFKGIGGPEMETPLLDFVEFCAKTMAALVDVFRVAVAGIETIIYGMMNLFNNAQELAMSRSDGLMTMASHIPGLKNNQGVVDYMADKKAREEAQSATYGSYMDAYSTFLHGPEENTYDKVSAQFDASRNRLLGSKYGVNMDPMAAIGAGIVPQAPGTQGFNVVTGLPDFLSPNAKKPSIADQYMDPLTGDRLQQIQDEIDRNSSAPNSGKKDKKGGRTVDQTEETRLIKELSKAQNEYTNILENKNLHEGQNEAQMRALISTDERYIKLSDDKKAKLLGYAKQLDDLLLKIENTKKAQQDWNEAMVAGYDAAGRIGELQTTGFESKYRNVSNMQNSFKEGGSNQFMDQLNREKELKAALKKDDDQRLLDMARYTAEIKNSNDEIYFQASLIGQSSLEIQKATEFHKIDLQIAQMSVGASDEQIQKYRQMGEVLKTDVGGALEYINEKQKSAFAGIMGSLNQYMDEASNVAAQWGDLATTSIQGTEDAIVSMCETGKASFADLAKAIMHDLIKMIVKYIILMILQRITGVGGGGSYSGSSMSWDGGGSSLAGGPGSLASGGGGVFDPHAKGGVFAFAKGGTFTNKMYDKATPFAFGGRFGVMGEAGPEAVMPLAKNSSGELGVKIAGGGGGDTEMKLNVEVYVGKGDGVKTEHGTGPNGDILKVIIGEVAADIKKGGQVHKAVTTTYGLKRTPKSYA